MLNIVLERKRVNVMKNRILELRKKNNISQSDVAKAINVTRQAISLYETGDREPKLETWQKLANFFGVSVSYLQGLTPNFDELTAETKDFIISELDKNYFSDNRNTKYKNARTELKQAVNEYANYAKLIPKPIEIKKDNDKARFKYWLQHFSFLFSADHLINWVNRYIYFTSNKYKHHLTYSHFIWYVKDLIRAQTIKEFQTNIGLFVSDKAEKRLENTFKSFERDLDFSRNINDLNNYFNSYINFLDDLRSELNESIKNVDLKLFAEKKRLEHAIAVEYFNLFIDGKFQVDKEKLKILDQKYGDNVGIIIALRKYKLKNNQDVTEIDKYLDLLGIKDDVLSEFSNIDDSKED